mmetsp:Transcript_36036/g.95685  ORF Transcript_36036/g.95685 Transcript_36036/m.95685 type:complete len:231 (-) Transcript_36036:54-746(-)
MEGNSVQEWDTFVPGDDDLVASRVSRGSSTFVGRAVLRVVAAVCPERCLDIAALNLNADPLDDIPDELLLIALVILFFSLIVVGAVMRARLQRYNAARSFDRRMMEQEQQQQRTQQIDGAAGVEEFEAAHSEQRLDADQRGQVAPSTSQRFTFFAQSPFSLPGSRGEPVVGGGLAGALEGGKLDLESWATVPAAVISPHRQPSPSAAVQAEQAIELQETRTRLEKHRQTL